jgi:hypothetical protein
MTKQAKTTKPAKAGLQVMEKLLGGMLDPKAKKPMSQVVAELAASKSGPAPKPVAAKPAPKAKAKAKAKAKKAKPATRVEVGGKGMTPLLMKKGSKQAAMYSLLLSPDGGTRDEIEKVAGRATMLTGLHSGKGHRTERLLKKLGAKMVTAEDAKRGTVYRIVAKKKAA